MKTGLTISTVLHALVLLWGLYNFAPRPLEAAATDSLPVDIISATDFSRMIAGNREAPKAEVPKPLAEKVAEPKPAENPAPKVVEKPEIIPTAAATPPEAKPEPKKEAERKQPEPKVDPIAEALKKDEAKKPEPKKQEAKVPAPPKKPPPPQQKFDPKQIEQRLALLDKREAQRHAATGDVLNPTVGLGTSTGTAPRLSQNEIDALRARLRECWNLPAGAQDAKDLNVEVRIMLRQDGSLSADPTVLNRSANPFFQVAAESALRAVRTCAPFSFLPIAKYEAWKDIEINFDPQYMFRS